ncbi:MAG: alpha/beta hydrolase [Planctomycetota bacterium]
MNRFFSNTGFFVAVVLCLVACSPRLQLVGIDNPEVPVASVAEATKHSVFIITTREDSDVVGALFSELRADELGFASVEVSVPPTHEIGNIEHPKSLPPDPRTEFAIVDPTVYGAEAAFVSALNSELRSLPPHKREVLFFVHGYNTSTSDAILLLGQFVEDSGFQGVPILFTWASAAKVTRYVYDLNSALAARPMLLKAADVVSKSIADDFFVFAHSMGTFLTMEAIVSASQSGRFNRSGRLQGVVLASPDIDVDVFRSQLAQVDLRGERFFVLLSEDDAALRASRIVAGGVDRVGNASAEVIGSLGVTAIDLSEVSDSQSGSHSKFTGSPEIVQLIGNGLNRAGNLVTRPQTILDEVLGELPVSVVFGN